MNKDGGFGFIQFLNNGLRASTFGGEVDFPGGLILLGLDWAGTKGHHQNKDKSDIKNKSFHSSPFLDFFRLFFKK